MTHDSRRYLPPDAVSRIAKLEILAREVVEGALSGLHRSPYFGQSVEFVQHREYVAGDDPRRIDWKAWSKTDRYYIKQYEEETNLRSTIVLDASESMQFGMGKYNKFDFGCAVAACLSYLLLKQQDSVGMIVFDDIIRSRIPHRSKHTHLHSILATLHAVRPAEKTDLFQILRQVADEQSHRGQIVLISDLFADREGLMKGLNLLRHRGHDVLLFHVLDDEELDFNYSGTTKFEGLEATGELLCDPRALRDGYLDAMHAFIQQIRRYCAGALVDYRTIRTGEHLDAVLRQYLNSRLGLRQSV